MDACLAKAGVHHMCPVQEDAARNLNVKRFVDVPMADIEVLFPDKKVNTYYTQNALDLK